MRIWYSSGVFRLIPANPDDGSSVPPVSTRSSISGVTIADGNASGGFGSFGDGGAIDSNRRTNALE